MNIKQISKVLILMSMIVVMVVLTGCSKQENTQKVEDTNISSEMNKEESEANQLEESVIDPNAPKSEKEALDFIHKMSNTIINAKDGMKWGNIKITPQNIDIAIESVQHINNQKARDYLYKELELWKKGEFDNGVEVHNYVWNMLGGTIGKAESLEYNEIKSIQKQYFN